MDYSIVYFVISFISLCLADDKPSCTFNLGQYGKDVVCRAGTSDYILQRGLVSDNNDTTGITLRGCKIIDVDYESFNDLNSLEYLDLSDNQITALKLGCLDEPHHLRMLNISHNRLTTFPLGFFDQTPKMEVLDISGNRINNIVLGTFDPLPNLRHVDLSNNAFRGKNLDPYLFDQSTKIKFMDFSRNDMSEAPDNMLDAFTSIDFLNLDRCFLKEVPSFATGRNLKTMKHLLLSTNMITRIDNPAIFVNLEDLQILNLVHNNIEFINEHVFKPLKKLDTIILRNNRLTVLPETIFQNMNKLVNIDLFSNSIENVPVNAFRGSPIRNLNLSYNKITYLQDNFCLELRNSGGKLKKLLFNDNPWQCACLLDLLKEVKSFGITYNKNKYNGQSPVCVTKNDFHCVRQASFNHQYIELYDNSIRNQ